MSTGYEKEYISEDVLDYLNPAMPSFTFGIAPTVGGEKVKYYSFGGSDPERVPAGVTHTYTHTAEGEQWVYDHPLEFHAVLKKLPNGIWKLLLIPRVEFHQIVEFPSQFQVHSPHEPNNLIYFPSKGGLSTQFGGTIHNSDWGSYYPGGLFAPLVILANQSEGVLISSAEWPLKRLKIAYKSSDSKIKFFHNQPFCDGVTNEYTIMIKHWRLKPKQTGVWQRGILIYRKWLHKHMPVPRHPEWIEKSEGFLNIGLQNMTRFDVDTVRAMVDRASDLTNWVLFWGQMSNYAGDSTLAHPPLADGETTGCCLPKIEPHRRYDGLKEFAEARTSQGKYTGYYSRLNPSPEGMYMGTVEGRQFLLDWIASNRTNLAANSYYLDEYGNTNYDETSADVSPYTSAFEDGTIPPETLIEGFVDIYPRPSLLSGSLFRGGIEVSLENIIHLDLEKASWLHDKILRTPTLRMVRLLMGNRIGFGCYSNGDSNLYGQNASIPFYSERQSFLTGLKLEFGYSENGTGGTAMEHKIVELRRRFRWWDRSPVYMDTIDISEVPDYIQVTRFVDNIGINLFAVDNPRQLRNQVFKYKDKTFLIPEDFISIVEPCDDTGILGPTICRLTYLFSLVRRKFAFAFRR